jgi:hypothetical protein
MRSSNCILGLLVYLFTISMPAKSLLFTFRGVSHSIGGVTRHQLSRREFGLVVPLQHSGVSAGLRKDKWCTILMAKKSSVRPTIDDIDKISRGQAAKKRGTGSRAVPHRLNEKERVEFDLAKKRKFVSLRGTGWRAERGDSPLANIYRNYCDAVNQPCISVRRGIFIDEEENTLGDEVIVDFSPLRKEGVTEERERVMGLVEGYSSVQRVDDASELSRLGFPVEELPDMAVEPIWRLPVYSISATFLERAEAKAFAEAVAAEKFKGARV